MKFGQEGIQRGPLYQSSILICGVPKNQKILKYHDKSFQASDISQVLEPESFKY